MKKSNSLASTTSLSKNNYNSESRKFIISSSIFLVAFFCLIVAFINDIRIEHVLNFHKRAFSEVTNRFQSSNLSNCSNNTTTTLTANTAPDNEELDELRILIGVLALADHYQHRDLLRRIYHVQPRPAGVRVDLKFVFCNLTTDAQKIQVQLEILAHNDIIILNCTENMDDGKTYTYFSSLPEMFSGSGDNPPYHYVMKTDYDTFIRVESLAESLKPLPREDLYYGFTLPCQSMEMRGDYMSGLGYVVSWDIVDWISKSEIPRNHVKGPEDMLVGDWLRSGNKGNNSFNKKWQMYNYPPNWRKPYSGCGHPLWPDTIAVHQLKTQDRWITILRYFNVTKDLVKPSKLLYHVV